MRPKPEMAPKECGFNQSETVCWLYALIAWRFPCLHATARALSYINYRTVHSAAGMWCVYALYVYILNDIDKRTTNTLIQLINQSIFLFQLGHIFSNTYIKFTIKKTASRWKICWKLFSLSVTYPGNSKTTYLYSEMADTTTFESLRMFKSGRFPKVRTHQVGELPTIMSQWTWSTFT